MNTLAVAWHTVPTIPDYPYAETVSYVELPDPTYGHARSVTLYVHRTADATAFGYTIASDDLHFRDSVYFESAVTYPTRDAAQYAAHRHYLTLA